MPRTARLDAPGVLHHVMARGVLGQDIFIDDADRREFVARLELACADGAAAVLAWCLMGNHFHLAIRSGGAPLSRVMRRLLTGYSAVFNKRHGRTGHVFQGRYKSLVVEEERYLLALVRYIHRNPVVGGLAGSMEELASWPWSGHAALMGGESPAFQAVEEILGRFGAAAGDARRQLSLFMEDTAGAAAEQKAFESGGGVHGRESRPLQTRSAQSMEAFDARILGDGAFVEAIWSKTAPSGPTTAVDPEIRRARLDAGLRQIIDEVARRGGVTVETLTGGSRRRDVSKLRSVVAYLAQSKLGLSSAALGRALGVSQPSIVRAVGRGREALLALGWEKEPHG